MSWTSFWLIVMGALILVGGVVFFSLGFKWGIWFSAVGGSVMFAGFAICWREDSHPQNMPPFDDSCGLVDMPSGPYRIHRESREPMSEESKQALDAVIKAARERLKDQA